MGIGILSTGNSAMLAAYTQLQVTSHNIANANTPGYTRQEAQLASAGANFTGSGYIGRGVELTAVKRNYNEYLTREVRQTQAQASGDSVRATEMSRIDRLFANSNQGLGAAIDDLAVAWGDVVSRPFDNSARSTVLARAQTLSQRVAGIDQQLEQSSQDVNARLLQSARAINPTLEKLAKLNDQLAAVGANQQSPNDLLDARDQMVAQINKTVRATAYENPDGTINLFSQGGDVLVLGNQAAKFGVQTDPLTGSPGITLSINGTTTIQTTASLGGGELSGLMQFRDDDLAQVRARLGQMVGSLASAINDIQTTGTDANGNTASPLFASGSPQVRSSAINAGNASFGVSVTDGKALAPSDYEITFSGGVYSVKRLTDGLTTNYAALPAQFDGLNVTHISGSPANGDRFLLKAGSAFTSGFKSLLTQPSQLAAGMAMTAVPSSTNGGDVAASAFSVQSTGANLTAPVTLTFTSSSSFDVAGTGTGNPSGQAYGAGTTLSFNGWTATLNGTPKAGDVITISPVAQPSADNRNAQRMLAAFNQSNSNGTSFTGSYADLVGDVGIKARSANDSKTLSSGLLLNAQAAQSEASGVNLDEEAAKLIQFQQAYQAAAKLISTGQQMFESLMSAIR